MCSKARVSEILKILILPLRTELIGYTIEIVIKILLVLKCLILNQVIYVS